MSAELLAFYAAEENCHEIAIDESRGFFKIWLYCVLWGIAVAILFHLPLHVFESHSDDENRMSLVQLLSRRSKRSSRKTETSKTDEEGRRDERVFVSEPLHGAPPRDVADTESEALPEVTVTFQPGPIGFLRNKGIVTDVQDGQAQREGVKVGWRIKAVNGHKCESFEDSAFEAAKTGDKPYQVTFAVSSEEVRVLNYFKRMSRSSNGACDKMFDATNICIRFLGVTLLEFDSPAQPKCDDPIPWPEIEFVGNYVDATRYAPPADLGAITLEDCLGSPDDVIAPQHCKVQMDETEALVAGDDARSGAVHPPFNRSSSSLSDLAVNLEAAERHLLKTSNTHFKDGAYTWRSVHGTTLQEIHEIGGEGIELYFRLVRGLGLCFAYMSICTTPIAAFSWNGNFLPDIGSSVAKSTIGNIGKVAPANFSQQDRYIILSCHGKPVKDFTTAFSCLDAIAILMFLMYIVYFALKGFSSAGSEEDLLITDMTDFTVKITGIPRRIDDQSQYEDRLKAFLTNRMNDLREKYDIGDDIKAELPPVEICEICLVRDFGKRLSMIKRRGELMREVEICKYKDDTKTQKKLEARIEKLNQLLLQRLDPEAQLPVLCAYVVINCQSDVENLLFNYRFARLRLLRLCQGEKKRFEGRAICFTRAPDPTNIIFENHDISTFERTLRISVNMVLWLLAVGLSATAIYLLTGMTKSSSQAASSQLGSSECDGGTHVPTDAYKCLHNVAVQWTNEQAAAFGSDELDCFCQTKGHTAVLTSDALRDLCSEWLTEVSIGYAQRILVGLIIVLVNVVFKGLVYVMVLWEKPFSVSSRSRSYMWKTFVSQFINTAVVICLLNWRAFGIFQGDYTNFERGWFASVGGAMIATLMLNAMASSVIRVCFIWSVRIRRRWRKRKMTNQADLISLYTNPAFDISSGYAQLLTTVFCTLVYSAGAPMVLYLASAYCLLTYWCDKWALLKCCRRPAKMDASLPQIVVQITVLSVPMHCAIAVFMYSNQCIFPSDPLGGDMGSASDSIGGSSLGAEMTRTSTWLLSLIFVVSVIVIVVWFILLFIGGSAQSALLICSYCNHCCTRRKRAEIGHVPSDASLVKVGAQTFDKARVTIEKVAPPASYKLDRHPDFCKYAKFLKGDRGWDSRIGSEITPGQSERHDE